MSGSGPSLRDRRDDGRPEQSRPRDRTGRPLPHGTTDVPLIESADPTTVDEAIALAEVRWGARRYFEAHELLEYAWKHGPASDRDLWKGVIQVAVAGVHLQRENPAGARRVLERALRRLQDQPDRHRGIDVAALRRTVAAAGSRLAAGEIVEADWGPLPKLPPERARPACSSPRTTVGESTEASIRTSG